jgi:phosphoglycerate dehydrogenase-like enzyme
MNDAAIKVKSGFIPNAGAASRIAVIDDWQKIAHSSADWSPLEARAKLVFFEEPFPDEGAAAKALADFDIVLSMRERTPFPVSLIERLPNLRMFGMTGRRALAIDSTAMIERGITVCVTGGGESGAETAEHTLGLILAAARRIPAGDAAIRAGRFQAGVNPGFGLAGKTLGVIGLGRIGSLVAGYGRALDMTVLGWSHNLTPARAAAAGVAAVSKEELLSRADIVSLHLVLAPETTGIIGPAELALMKPGAILVNTSRASLVDEDALIESLRASRLIAALDVFNQEPLPPDHPLCLVPNTVLTPHFGYGTQEVLAEFYRHSIENALAFLDGKPIRVYRPQDT